MLPINRAHQICLSTCIWQVDSLTMTRASISGRTRECQAEKGQKRWNVGLWVTKEKKRQAGAECKSCRGPEGSEFSFYCLLYNIAYGCIMIGNSSPRLISMGRWTFQTLMERTKEGSQIEIQSKFCRQERQLLLSGLHQEKQPGCLQHNCVFNDMW